MRSWIGAIAVAAALAAPTPTWAQEALYGAQPPPGSAYLRFANALPAATTVTPEFMPVQRLGAEGGGRIGPYVVVEKVKGRALPFAVQGGTSGGSQPARSSLQVEPGSFNTVLLQPKPDGSMQAVPVRDKGDFNQSRVALSFYNATTQCSAAALRLEPAGTSVFQNVGPGAAVFRDVAPVEADVRAVCGEAPTAPFTLTGLEAGTRFSIWVMPTNGGPTAFLLRDTVQRYKP